MRAVAGLSWPSEQAWQCTIGHGIRMSGPEDHWLLHGTPLTPAVWDGVAAYLAQSGAVSCPAITPAAAPTMLRAP